MFAVVAVAVAAGGQADTGFGDSDEIPWKVRVLKARTAAPSKATTATPSKVNETAKPAPAAKTVAPKTAALSNSKAEPPAKGAVSWYRPVTFAELPGWLQDDHLVAFKVFLNSCERVVANGRDRAPGDGKGPQVPPSALVAVCSEAIRVAADIADKDKARAFFEASFTPNAVVKKAQPSLLTGYYEPMLEGSRTREGPYQTPI